MGANRGQGPAPACSYRDADTELDRDHAGGVLHDVVEIGTVLEPGPEVAFRRPRLYVQYPCGHHIGHDEGVGVLLVTKGPGTVPVQVDRSETGAAHPEREAEHGPDAGTEGLRGKG
jgi:hypothetical protein